MGSGRAARRSATADRSSATPRSRRLLRGRQEGLQVGDAIAAVTARVDAPDRQPPLLGPGPDGVGVDAEDASRQRDADGALAERGQRIRGRLRWQVLVGGSSAESALTYQRLP